MSDSTTGPGCVAFDEFTVDRARRELRYGSSAVQLTGKAFDLLMILVTAGGAVVTRERLYDQLWPSGSVEDGNLTQHVYLLRRALESRAKGRPFIQTLPRYGYRFVPDVFAPGVRELHTPTIAPRRPRRLAFVRAFTAAAILLIVGPAAVGVPASPLTGQAAIAYALGRYQLDLRTPASLTQSTVYFRDTVRERPQSALGYAGLASAYALLAEYHQAGSARFKHDLAFAQHFAHDALARDGTSAEAHAIAGFLAYRFEGDAARAERELATALARSPRDAEARHWYAVVLFARGEVDGAIAQWEIAREIDPTSEIIARWLGRAYYYAGRPDAAIRVLSDALVVEPNDAPALLTLASAQEQRGKLHDALNILAALRRRMPSEDPFIIPNEARLRLLLRHRPVDARTAANIDRLASAGQIDAFEAARFFATCGSRQRAVALLRRADRKMPVNATMEHLDPRRVALGVST
jgi:DNA-binding winged helix-turn-helix (wHTH) protein/tetratricopeptide (TPR) repeat protein